MVDRNNKVTHLDGEPNLIVITLGHIWTPIFILFFGIAMGVMIFIFERCGCCSSDKEMHLQDGIISQKKDQIICVAKLIN
jgi:hypothetical protein